MKIIYYSGTGNTKAMAELIQKGIVSEGSSAELLEVENATIEDVKNEEKIILGCPSMGDEVLEEETMEPFMCSIEEFIKDKKVALFGSYGWGDGAWMRDWEERVKSKGAVLIDDVIVNYAPDEEGEDICIELGRKIAKA